MKKTAGVIRLRLNWGKVFSYIFLILLAAAYLGPILMLLNTSLKTMPSFMRDATAFAKELNFRNFADSLDMSKNSYSCINLCFFLNLSFKFIRT